MVNKFTLLNIFLDDLTKTVTLAEFERYFKKPHQTLRKYLDILVEEQILKEEKGIRLRKYRLSPNPLQRHYVIMCEYQRTLKFLEDKKMFLLAKELLKLNAKILIFGSAIQNKDYNDIDILIISENKKIVHKSKEITANLPFKLHFIYSKQKISDKYFKNELKQKHIFLNSHDFFIGELYEIQTELVQG